VNLKQLKRQEEKLDKRIAQDGDDRKQL